MKKKKAWHEQDTFWKNVEPVLFHQQRLSNAANETDKITVLLGLKSGCRIRRDFTSGRKDTAR